MSETTGGEIVPFDRGAAAPAVRGERDVVDGWMAMVEPVARLATDIANTDFVPAGLRGKPAAITAAVLYGREIGLGPIQSLQSVDVIDGRPAISAEMARALALSAGHELYVEESTTTRCVVRGRRAASREWVTVTWTIDDAKRAGIDGKPNYRRHPRRMLQARATAELCHLLFADAIGGMPFTVEEIEDDSDAGGGVGTETTGRTARRAARPRSRAAAPAPAEASTGDAGAEPPLPGESGYDGDGEADEPITQPQMRKIGAMFRELGLDDRARRLEVTSALLARAVESSKDLTKQEAGALIETLERVKGSDDPAGRLVALVEASAAATDDGGGAYEGDDATAADDGEHQATLPGTDKGEPTGSDADPDRAS